MNRKRWLFIQAAIVVAIVWTGWLIKIQLTPVAFAGEVPRNEIFVQLDDGRLVPYHQVKIVPVDKPATQTSQAKALTDFQIHVYAQYELYERYGTGVKYLSRLERYNQIIEQAALYLGLDPDVARGLISVESMGIPDIVSPEDAIGLTQILIVPDFCQRLAKRILGVKKLDPYNPAHNIWLGLITLKYYTQLRDNDLALGLVSYNYGPNRLSVVQATDWTNLAVSDKIKSYPAKVLAVALLAKVQAKYGQALPLNEDNRKKIEAIPLPGI